MEATVGHRQSGQVSYGFEFPEEYRVTAPVPHWRYSYSIYCYWRQWQFAIVCVHCYNYRWESDRLLLQGREVRRGLIKKKRFVRGRGELTWRDKSNLPLNKAVQRQSHCSIGQSIKLGSNVIARHEKVLDSVSDFRLICFLRKIEEGASKSWPQLNTSMVPSCENWYSSTPPLSRWYFSENSVGRTQNHLGTSSR